MNCRQAVDLTGRYHDKRLDKDLKHEYEKHMETCEKCKNSIMEEKDIYYFLSFQAGCIPNYNIDTDNVMKEIYKLQQSYSLNTNRTQKERSLFFQRVGISMVLAAAIMVFSCFLPVGRINIVDRPVHASVNYTTQRQPYFQGTFDKLDNRIKSFIKSFGFNF